ncbi:MAG: hypothetical protein K6E63_11430 [Lachnospiraceae bacterium]|nr:hypothetical protein [Lachnospiraceae bacterium]
MAVKNKKKKPDPVVMLLDFVIVVMIFVLIAVGFRLYFYVHLTTRSMKFSQDASRMSFDLSRDDYAALIEGKYMNTFNGNNDAKSYHVLADYVEALSQYKIFSKKGYDEKALEQKTKMDRSRKEMGDLSVFADKADVMFGN